MASKIWEQSRAAVITILSKAGISFNSVPGGGDQMGEAVVEGMRVSVFIDTLRDSTNVGLMFVSASGSDGAAFRACLAVGTKVAELVEPGGGELVAKNAGPTRSWEHGDTQFKWTRGSDRGKSMYRLMMSSARYLAQPSPVDGEM